jgi:hypothetical protein
MDWIYSEIPQRRDELLLEASHVRLQRQAMRRRPNSIRGRIADSALSLSELLAHFAQAVRAKA